MSPNLKKVVYKEGDEHVERAQPTVFAPSTEQDRLKGIKTQSIATLGFEVPFGTASPGGPRSRDTMGEVNAHARHEATSKFTSKNPPKVGTPSRKGDDRFKYTYDELMAFCTNLCEDLLKHVELINSQQKEIDALKRVVFKLVNKKEKKKFQLKEKKETVCSWKRMKKVGTAQRISSSSSSSSFSHKSNEDATKKGEKFEEETDQSESRYMTFSRMLKSMSREDLEEMHQVGSAKGLNLQKEFDENKMVMEYLNMMFDPEEAHTVNATKFSPVTRWQLFEHNGVYSITLMD